MDVFILKGWLCTKAETSCKAPIQVMVWAGISQKGVTNRCILGCSVNSTVYQEVLRMHLLPFLCEQIPNSRFQQDSSPCHTSKATQRFCQAIRNNVLKTPPESLDLNPIENLWHEMKHFSRTAAKHRNKEELLQGIQSFWATVTLEKRCRYREQLKKIVPNVIEVNGEATGY